jgi:hypothetical protein
MGTISEKLIYLNNTKTAIAAAITNKEVTVPENATFRDYATLIEEISGGGNLQEGTVTPTGEEFVVTPDEGYDGFSVVTVEGDVNLTPENIVNGITIYGVTGESSLAPTSSLPSQYQDLVDYAETLYGGTYDNLIVLESNGHITIGFLMSDFTVTNYNSSSSEFMASGWFMCGYDKIAQTWSTSDYTINASTGGNYINNVRFSSSYVMYGTTVLYPLNSYVDVIGDGSIAVAFLKVACSPYYTVTLVCGSNTLTGNYAMGVTNLTFALPTTGTWVGTVVYDGATVANFSVDIAPYIYVTNSYPVTKHTLANDTWADISSIAHGGNAYMYYDIGDEKDITLTSGETVTLIILGFYHDTLESGAGFAGITFGMKHLLATTYNMNSSDTNLGGWDNSLMRTRLQPGGAIYDLLPTEVKNVIRPVRKIASQGNQSSVLITSVDYLFLLSEKEVFGTTTFSKDGEGTRYDYYLNYANTSALRVKKLSNGSGSAYSWWERSPYDSNETFFCRVYSSGDAYGGGAGSSGGVSFGFCV